MSQHNREMGSSGEELAVSFLENIDFTILGRNYRYGRYGEIDIIAKQDALIIFVEVKNRNSEQFGGPLYSISRKKKNSLKSAATSYLSQHPQYNTPDIMFRFDLISIIDCRIDWHKDIFR